MMRDADQPLSFDRRSTARFDDSGLRGEMAVGARSVTALGQRCHGTARASETSSGRGSRGEEASMLTGPHSDCHSTVVLHQPPDRRGNRRPRKAAATARSKQGGGPRQQQGRRRGKGRGGMLRGPAPSAAGARGGVLDRSHHVTGKTTDRRPHDNRPHRRRRALTRAGSDRHRRPRSPGRSRLAKSYPRSRRPSAASPRPPAPPSPPARASARSPMPNAPASSAPAKSSAPTCYGR